MHRDAYCSSSDMIEKHGSARGGKRQNYPRVAASLFTYVYMAAKAKDRLAGIFSIVSKQMSACAHRGNTSPRDCRK